MIIQKIEIEVSFSTTKIKEDILLQVGSLIYM